MLGALSLEHWVIVVAIAVVLFGSSRIRDFLADLGGGIRGLKKVGKAIVEEQDDAKAD